MYCISKLLCIYNKAILNNYLLGCVLYFLKSELFLKLRRKIELTYNNSDDKGKVLSIAREYNFSKEKGINSIVEKIENARRQGSTFIELF